MKALTLPHSSSYRRNRSRGRASAPTPWWLSILELAVAFVAVTGLLWVLFMMTEVVR